MKEFVVLHKTLILGQFRDSGARVMLTDNQSGHLVKAGLIENAAEFDAKADKAADVKAKATSK